MSAATDAAHLAENQALTEAAALVRRALQGYLEPSEILFRSLDKLVAAALRSVSESVTGA